MSLTSLLRFVVRILEEAGVPYMLTGSLAAAYYATPRATQDLDVVIHTQEEGIERLVRDFVKAGLYIDGEAALHAWRVKGRFNAIDPTSGWKVDPIVRKDRAFSREEFERRERAELLGIEVALASLEDVVITKLEWASMGDSELQRSDVVRLVERNEHRFDEVYLEKWLAELGLVEEWRSVLARVRNDPPAS